MAHRRTRSTIGLASLLALFLTTTGTDAAASVDRRDLEAFVDGWVRSRMDSFDVSGVTLSIVHHDEVVLAKGYGLADRATSRPVDAANTLFRPGSISKTFTWTAVMQLVEQGRLDLDADIRTYLGDLEIPSTFDEPITLQHLMSHTPGFEDTALGHLFEGDPAEVLPLADYLRRYQPARVRPPGVVPAYSNYGSGLAGQIVASVSGLSFEQYAERHLLGPLGMEHSTFRQPLGAEHPGAMATALEKLVSVGYRRLGGRYDPGGFEFVPLVPAGAMSTTALDMTKWMLVHLNQGTWNGVQILRPETARRMQGQSFAMDPALPGTAHGWIESRVHGYRTIGHGGGTIHFLSDLQLVPELDLGVFVSTNTNTGGQVMKDFVRELVGRTFPGRGRDETPAPSVAFEERADRFAGTYLSSRRNFTTAERPLLAAASAVQVSSDGDGTLLVASPLGEQRIVEVAPLLFREIEGDALIRFVEEDGEITGFLPSIPVMVYERAGPAENPILQFAFLGAAACVFVLAWVGAWLRRKQPLPDTRAERWAYRSLLAAAAIWIVFALQTSITGLAAADDYRQTFYDFPLPAFVLSLTIALVGAVLTAASAAGLVPIWKHQSWPLPRRIRHTLLVLLATTTVLLLHDMNWLGYHYY